MILRWVLIILIRSCTSHVFDNQFFFRLIRFLLNGNKCLLLGCAKCGSLSFDLINSLFCDVFFDSIEWVLIWHIHPSVPLSLWGFHADLYSRFLLCAIQGNTPNSGFCNRDTTRVLISKWESTAFLPRLHGFIHYFFDLSRWCWVGWDLFTAIHFLINGMRMMWAMLRSWLLMINNRWFHNWLREVFRFFDWHGCRWVDLWRKLALNLLLLRQSLYFLVIEVLKLLIWHLAQLLVPLQQQVIRCGHMIVFVGINAFNRVILLKVVFH